MQRRRAKAHFHLLTQNRELGPRPGPDRPSGSAPLGSSAKGPFCWSRAPRYRDGHTWCRVQRVCLVWNLGPTISGPVWQPVTEEPAPSAPRHKACGRGPVLCGCVVGPHMPQCERLSETRRPMVPELACVSERAGDSVLKCKAPGLSPTPRV